MGKYRYFVSRLHKAFIRAKDEDVKEVSVSGGKSVVLGVTACNVIDLVDTGDGFRYSMRNDKFLKDVYRFRQVDYVEVSENDWNTAMSWFMTAKDTFDSMMRMYVG